MTITDLPPLPTAAERIAERVDRDSPFASNYWQLTGYALDLLRDMPGREADAFARDLVCSFIARAEADPVAAFVLWRVLARYSGAPGVTE
jgi:hypothetical protein